MTELTCEHAQVVGTVHRAMNDVNGTKKGGAGELLGGRDTEEYDRKRKGGEGGGRWEGWRWGSERREGRELGEG